MENNEQAQVMMTASLNCGDLEAVICIPRARYDELVKIEMEREILFHAYRQMGKFDIEHVMDAIFNPQFKYRERSDAQ